MLSRFHPCKIYQTAALIAVSGLISMLALCAVAEPAGFRLTPEAEKVFILGQLAESESRWKEAEALYARAAQIQPTFETLKKAREFAWRAGDYDAAFRFGEELIAWAEAQGTSELLSTALKDHATTLQALGRHQQAEAKLRQALAIDEKTIGKTHPDYAAGLSNLAGVVRLQGDYLQAEALYGQAIAIDEAASGKDNIKYALRLSNLAGVLREKGQYFDAEMLYRQAIAIFEAKAGTDNPDHATYLNNLALVVQMQGRYDEAERLYRQALVILETAFGKNHPQYANKLRNLAGVLLQQGKVDEAREIVLNAVSIFRAQLGDAHPETQQCIQDAVIVLTSHFPTHPEIPALQVILTPKP
jgi:tetratricopeptide (TPR) repeat protein